MILVKFSEDLENVNDSQFIKARVRCFSDKLTSHGYYFDLDSVKDASKTLLGKPILWAYDFWTDDCKGHEDYEIPCGFIPDTLENANIEYVYDEEYDKTFVEVDCYIWRVYAEKLEEILLRTNGVKDVSVELWILEEEANENQNRIDVSKYCYTGVTILGESINPAVKGAKIEVIKFSENDYEKAKEEFIKHTLCNSKEEGEKMEENKVVENSEVQELDNAMVRETVRVSVTKDTETYDDRGCYVGNTCESHIKSETTYTQVDESEVVSNSENVNTPNSDTVTTEINSEITEENCSENIEEDYKVKFEEMSNRYDDLQQEYDNLKNSYKALELKCSELSDYKTNKETAEMKVAIECAISEVSDVLTPTEITEWREKSIDCENLDAFRNELKAFAYDKKVKCADTKTTIRNPIPMNTNIEDKNVWNRLRNEF